MTAAPHVAGGLLIGNDNQQIVRISCHDWNPVNWINGMTVLAFLPIFLLFRHFDK
jgi:hypothetical protein